MTITLRDVIRFPFNNGRGINPSQVNWSQADSAFDSSSRDVHFITGLTYNEVTNQFEGSLFHDVDSIPIGRLIFLIFSSGTADNGQGARVSVELDGTATIFTLRDAAFGQISNNELILGTIYWGYMGSNNRIRLIEPIGGGSVPMRKSRVISNAELKALDTTPVEIIAAPGAGKLISIDQVLITKAGDDAPTGTDQTYIIAISPNTTLTEAEAMAGNSYTDTGAFVADERIDVPDFSDANYVYVGLTSWFEPLDWASERQYGAGRTLSFADFDSANPITLMVDGVEYVFFRTNNTYASRNAFHRSIRVSYGQESTAPSAHQISHSYRLGLVVPSAGGIASNPYAPSYDKVVTVAEQNLYRQSRQNSGILFAANGELIATSIGSHILYPNQPLNLAVYPSSSYNYFPDTRAEFITGAYSTAALTRFWNGVDDVSLTVTVRYQVIDTI